MPLDMEVGLGPGDFVFDGDLAPPRKKAQPPPSFCQCSLCPIGWMDEAATLYGSRPRPRPHCVRQGPSSPAKGAQQPPCFWPMPLVATVSHLSYTAELLLSKLHNERHTDGVYTHRLGRAFCFLVTSWHQRHKNLRPRSR